MASWRAKQLCVEPGRVRLDGEWADVGEGGCERCGVIRRLYSPAVRTELRVCAQCSKIYVNRSIQEADSRTQEAQGDDLDEVPEPGPGWDAGTGEFVE